MNDRSDQVIAWFNKADHDLGSAKIIYLHLPDYFDTIAFHCQQAVEKYIKALLIYRNIAFPSPFPWKKCLRKICYSNLYAGTTLIL